MEFFRKTAAPVVAGALFPLAFAPYGFSFLALFSLAVLFYVWYTNKPGQNFLTGWLFGLGQFGVGVSWVYISVHDFGGTPVVPAAIITTLFVMLMAVFPACAGYGMDFFRRRNRLNSSAVILLLMPSAWGLMEWVRGWFLSGFPWLLTGYTQIDSGLSGYAPVGGVYMVSWVSAVSAGVLSDLYINKRQVRRFVLPALVFMALWLGGMLLQKVSWTELKTDPVKVALVQGNIGQELKWLPSMKWPTIDRYFKMTEEEAQDSDLVIWPETAIPVLYDGIKDILLWFRDKALSERPAILTGVPVVESRDGRIYNSMVLLSDEPEQFYYKRHLVPFGEYLPVRTLLSWAAHLFPLPGDDFSSGDFRQPALQLGENKLSISICYEDAFGNEMLPTLPAANMLINVSNDAWFGQSMAAAQHLQMARMRALEFGRPMLRATNTGISAMIDSKGKIFAQAPQFEQTVLEKNVYPAQGETPYMYWGNAGIVSIYILLLLYAGVYLQYKRVNRL